MNTHTQTARQRAEELVYKRNDNLVLIREWYDDCCSGRYDLEQCHYLLMDRSGHCSIGITTAPMGLIALDTHSKRNKWPLLRNVRWSASIYEDYLKKVILPRLTAELENTLADGGGLNTPPTSPSSHTRKVPTWKLTKPNYVTI